MKRIIAFIAGITMLATLAACGNEYSTSASTGTNGTSETSVVDPNQISDETIASLTVNTVDVSKCLTLTDSVATGVVPISIGALELPVPQGPRLWSDALSVPLVETEPLKQLAETQTSICKDTLTGATWGRFFAKMEVGGVKLLDLNPWLATFDVPEDQINDVATGFIPLLDFVGTPSDEQKKSAVAKNLEWQSLAVKLDTLLERWIALNVQTQPSVLSYHLTGGGLTVGQLPEVGINPNQENLPALILVVMEKGACVPLKVIGINVGDQRPEEFAPPVCEVPPVTTAPPGGSTPPTTPPVTTPGVTTTTQPGSTTTTTQPTDTTTTQPTVTTTTQPDCGTKCHPATTVAPPPVTATPPTTAVPSGPTTSVGDSGPGAPPPATTVAPTPTVAPPGSIPTTSAPTPPGTHVTLP